MRPDFVRIGRTVPPPARLRARAGLTAAALLVTGSLIGWGAATGGPASAEPAPGAAVATVPAGAGGRTIGGAVDSYAPLVEQVAPAVVTVRSERRATAVSQSPSPFDHPMFREFFGDRFRMPDQPQPRAGLGSGVIVRSDGYILTNHHVVDGARQVTVELTDGRILDATVVGSDAPSDLAVLKVEGANLATLSLGDSDQVRVGDVALAIGNPMGIGQTVTMGIVSAKGRATGLGDGSFEDFIQTDAPINRGNSGGALVNTRGELIGINSQILSPSGGNIGIGFSIPANMARSVMTQLIEHGEVRRGMLGVTIQPVTSDIARSLGLPQVQGALVSSVQPGSPAEKGGVKRGDVVIGLNDAAVRDNNALRNEIAMMQPGTRATLTILRDGREQKVSVTLGELSTERAAAEGEGGRDQSDATGFGMTVEPLTRETARQLGVQASSGLVVTRVQPGGQAARAGLRTGDVIEEVDRTKVDSLAGLRTALSAGDAPALLLVHRGDSTIYLTMNR